MLQGTFAAMMTPLDENGGINARAAEELTEFIIEKGAMGLFPVSNVGGMIHMRPDEKARFIKIVVARAKDRVPVYPGVNASSTRESIALSRMCEETGADGCILSAPFYFPYPQSVVLSGLTAVARRSPLPIVLYNIPKYAGEITLDSFRALMREQNIIGVKDSSGSMANLLNLISTRDEIRPDFSVLVGWEEMLCGALQAGGQGCMTASSGIFPEIMSDIYHAVRAKKYAYALRCQKLIARATAVFGQLFFPLGYQWAMEARGIPLGAYPVSCDEAAFAPQKEAIERAVAEALAGYAALRAEAIGGNEAL